jgi:hypothetical protein
MKTLIWSVAWNEYRFMLQSLVSSIREAGLEHDILTFSDEPIHGTISCEIDKKIDLDFKQYWKFEYLLKVCELDYDLFVFIDSDHYFVRKPSKEFCDIIGSDPWHSFLESPLNSSQTKRPDWWGVPNGRMVKLYKDFGIIQKTAYSTNGGFWMCKKGFARHAAATAARFKNFQRINGMDLPEEVFVAILSHMFSTEYQDRFHSNYEDIWASEWTGALSDKIPDGSPWEFQEYMTNAKKVVNPAIVHAMRSKNALVSKGKQVLEHNEAKFVSWEDVLKEKKN